LCRAPLSASDAPRGKRLDCVSTRVAILLLYKF
jgi:hypothetical protein